MVDIIPGKMGRFSCRERIARTASTETFHFFSGQLYPIISNKFQYNYSFPTITRFMFLTLTYLKNVNKIDK